MRTTKSVVTCKAVFNAHTKLLFYYYVYGRDNIIISTKGKLV